ncbi:hypothetical protein AAG906_026660 [Vitis piasezkii]
MAGASRGSEIFLQWSRAVLTVVRGCGKLGYLNGTITELAKTDLTYPTWDTNNLIVMSWLVNSMTDKSCTADYERYRARINKERIYDFNGLNKELDEVQGRFLRIKPLPVIEEIFAEVRREETRKRVMLGGRTTSFGVITVRDPITAVKTAGSKIADHHISEITEALGRNPMNIRPLWDVTSRKRIGNAEKYGAFYYFKEDNT